MRGGRHGRESQLNFFIAVRANGGGGGGRGGRRLNQRDGRRRKGRGDKVVQVSDEVDILPLVVDGALLRRDGMLLFALVLQVGEDQGTRGAAAYHHQC